MKVRSVRSFNAAAGKRGMAALRSIAATRTFVAFILLSLCAACSNGQGDRSGQSADSSRQTPPESIVGAWTRDTWDLYHTLYFEADSTVVCDNHIDTLFRFTYRVEGNTLYLRGYADTLWPVKIVALSNESLTLEGLPHDSRVLSYRRKTGEL